MNHEDLHSIRSMAALTAFVASGGAPKYRVLVEASPKDCIWGIGLGAGRASTTPPDAWRGLNLLGFALMEARARVARATA